MSADQREYQRRLYDRHYESRATAVRDQLSHPLFRSFHLRLAQRVFDQTVGATGTAQRGRVVRVLEPGCGEGLLASALQEEATRRGLVLRYTGSDISAAALELTKDHVDGDLRLGDGIEVLADLPAGSQDVVIVKNLLHHLDAPGDLLRQAARVSQPEGKVVIVEPRLGCPHMLAALVLAPRRERHYFRGQRRNVAALRAANLRVVHEGRFSSLPWELAFLIRPRLFRRLFSTDDPGVIARVAEIEDRFVAAVPWLATYVVWVAASSATDEVDGTKRS